MLNYERQGNGEVLVLIHGFLGSRDVFNEVMDKFVSRYDVIAIDLPGQYRSEIEREAYSVYDFASAVADVLKHEKVSEATWLGHSMGGYIVLAALERNIAPIKRAILAYSSDTSDTEEQIEKRSKQQKQILETGVRTFVDEVMGAFFSENASNEQIESAKQIAYQASPNGLILALDTMKTRPNQGAFIEHTTTPILVIEGTEDKIVKPIETNNPNVTKVYTETGHLGMIEDPKSFATVVHEFMENV